MPINSYFFDAVNDDRVYSAADFARAFDIVTETGFLIRETSGGKFGFDIGGTNYTTIYEGKAVVEGRLVELTGTETLTVPAGTYSGQIVLRVDFVTFREATIVVKDVRAPVQTETMFELPMYDVAVSNGIITAVTDLRFQGGCIPNNHNHKLSELEGASTAVTWFARDNGVYLQIGDYSIALTPQQPPYSAKRVWIQVD